MNNQVVWGLPHVFATFNHCSFWSFKYCSISSVFNIKCINLLEDYPHLAICLLTGGLIVLVLDLGRPDRLIVAMTTLILNQYLRGTYFI